MTEDWTKEWERRVVNGVYPLRRYLGRSGHSVVFLTECKAQNVAQAAIKILPAIPALMDLQLGYWKRVASLSHPHLVRLLDTGRCQLGGHNFLFVVMGYAEQSLAQVLPGRPLTPDEVRDLLPGTLDALTYLHGKNLVQGALKPPNFLSVDDQLKLASDTIRPAGERTVSTAKPSLYDAPEAKKGRISTAGDIWGLGIMLAEALTQTPPAWSRENSDYVALPANLAPEFVDTIQRCLNRDPGRRPTIADLAAQFKKPAPRTPPPAATPVADEPPTGTAPSAQNSAAQNSAAQNSAAQYSAPQYSAPQNSAAYDSATSRLPLTGVSAAIIGLCVLWLVVHLFRGHAHVQPSAAVIPPSPPAVSPPAAAENPRTAAAPALPVVLHQELPDVSRGARESIRGVIKIAVRVSVDGSGNVVAATLDHRASSRYFARVAMDAARKWKFSQAADQGSQAWLLTFGFTRANTTAHAAAVTR